VARGADRSAEVEAAQDADYLARLDDRELKREGIGRMLDAERRGTFPLRDDAFIRSMREHHHREEAGT